MGLEGAPYVSWPSPPGRERLLAVADKVLLARVAVAKNFTTTCANANLGSSVQPKFAAQHRRNDMGREHVGGLTSVPVPRGPRSGADRDLRVVIAENLTGGGSLMAAERRRVILGGRLVILVVNEH